MKQFYFCIDSWLSATQVEQHYWAKRFAEKLGGEIVFYGAEELRVIDVQPFVLAKLSRTPGLDGVIFFTFQQFCLSEKLNINLIRNILILGLSVHFVREDVSLASLSELSENFLLLTAYKQSNRVSLFVDNGEIDENAVSVS